MCMDMWLDMLSMLVFVTGVYREGGCDYRGIVYRDSVYRGGRDLDAGGGSLEGPEMARTKKRAGWLSLMLSEEF